MESWGLDLIALLGSIMEELCQKTPATKVQISFLLGNMLSPETLEQRVFRRGLQEAMIPLSETPENGDLGMSFSDAGCSRIKTLIAQALFA